MPFDSLYEATKSSIHQQIFSMNQKLRKKNQMQLQKNLINNLYQQSILHKQDKQLKNLHQIYLDNLMLNRNILYKSGYNPYVNSFLYQSTQNQPNPGRYLYPNYKINQSIQMDPYWKKLRKINEQTLALQNRAANGYRAQLLDQQINKYFSPIHQFNSNKNSPNQQRDYNRRRSPKSSTINRNLQYDQLIDEDSSALLEKYSKGIRAQQYNRDIQRLIDIEKNLKKIQSNPNPKPHFPYSNQLRAPYQPKSKFDTNEQKERNKQKGILIETFNPKINEKIKVQPGVKEKQVPIQKGQKIGNTSLFQNQKVGEVINKRQQSLEKCRYQGNINPNLNENRQAKDKLDKSIKAVQKINFLQNLQSRNLVKNKNSLTKLIPYNRYNRSSTSKQKKKYQQSISRSQISTLSPLKSDRLYNQRFGYKPYLNKTSRKRPKSHKHNTSRFKNYANISEKKTHSRLLDLDPYSEKNFCDFLKTEINLKIQNRLRLQTCSFKDARMRQSKNEIQSLLHRYEIQAKGRKQIKSNINNDPHILRKHKMVFE